MVALDVVWEALAMGKVALVEAMDLSTFDWQASHANFGTPLHAVLFGKTKPLKADDDEESKGCDRAYGWGHIFAPELDKAKSRLALLRFVLNKGADPAAVPRSPCKFVLQKSFICNHSAVDDEWKVFDFSGKSPGACLLAVERAALKAMTPDDANDLAIKDIQEALRMLCSASDSGPMVRNTMVPVGFLDVCKAHAADVKSHDVAIVVQDEAGKAQESLTAHSGMLCATSAVLKAMLSTCMSEGLQKRIVLQDTSRDAVEVFLHVSYTGQIQHELANVAALLGSLELAHRWQALHVVQVVVVALEDRVDIHCLVECLEVALRLVISSLRTVCSTFALRHVEAVRHMLQVSGVTINPAARAELDRLVIKKRRRS